MTPLALQQIVLFNTPGNRTRYRLVQGQSDIPIVLMPSKWLTSTPVLSWLAALGPYSLSVFPSPEGLGPKIQSRGMHKLIASYHAIR